MVLYIMENTKKFNKKKWKNRDYYVQHNKYVENQDVKMYCETNQFTELKFLGPHNKPHGACGLGKNYHMRFNPKLGHGEYVIHHTPCACTLCTSSIEQPWIKGFP